MGGHVRVFNVSALVQMLKDHGLKVTSATGEASLYKTNWIIKTIDRFMTKLSPTLASSFRVKCTL